MSLKTLKDMKSEKGFTIVELLIVIVIIGILAAIVIVAYNGITERARTSGYQSDANSIVKVAEAINAELGDYPTTAAGFAPTGFTTAKLPANVALDSTVIAANGTVPTTEAGSEPSESGGVKTYKWQTCGDKGVIVYYWDGDSVATSKAGSPTAGADCSA